MDKLNENEIASRLSLLATWSRKDQKWINRKYRFQSFKDSIRFVNQVAEAAETMNHHPLISIDYRVVTLHLTTWKAAGLTDVDFTLAEQCDNLYASFAEKTE